MNDKPTSQPEKKQLSRTPLVIGISLIVVIIAWLSVQLISSIPGNFSSLASLAGALKSPFTSAPNNEILVFDVINSETLIDTNGTVQLSWKKQSRAGTYSFTFQCTDGLVVELVESENQGLRPLDCDTVYNIGDTDSITLKINSNNHRYVDVLYTINYQRSGEETVSATGSGLVAVINKSINGNETSQPETVTTNTAPTNTADTKEKEETSATNTQTPASAVEQTKPSIEYVYTIPVSDPKGQIDLGVKYVNTGKIINNQFIPSTISRSTTGAIQFEVRNYGTKTSKEWRYTVVLPNGTVYESKEQVALRPNERVVLSIGFPASNMATHTFEVKISEPSDYTAVNNSFKQTVSFLK